MGFGSYDESEQEQRTANDMNEDEAVSVRETNHDGDVSFESDVSQDELLDKLQQMKD